MLTSKDIQQIKLALQSGFWVKVSVEEDDVMNQYTAIAYDSISDCADFAGERKYDEWNLGDCQSYQIIPRPQHEFKVGDRVKVIYSEFDKKIVGEAGTIERIGSDTTPWRSVVLKIDSFVRDANVYVNPEWLCPIVEDDSKIGSVEDTKFINGKDVFDAEATEDGVKLTPKSDHIPDAGEVVEEARIDRLEKVVRKALEIVKFDQRIKLTRSHIVEEIDKLLEILR